MPPKFTQERAASQLLKTYPNFHYKTIALPRPLKIKARTQNFVSTPIIFCVQVADIVNRQHSYLIDIFL